MAGPRTRKFLQSLQFEVVVRDLQRNRPAQCDVFPDAGQNLDMVRVPAFAVRRDRSRPVA